MKFITEYVVLIFCCAFLDAVKFRCDYRYTNVGWFKYHEIPATWYDARLQCQLEGAMLASPTSDKIKSIMMESFCKPEIFTGIHSTFSRGQYHTINGIPLAQIPHKWARYEPDNKNNAERCLALNSDGKFSDVTCDEPRPYICYREYSEVDATICGTPDPEYHFDSQTNNCYKFHSTRRPFDRAHFACSAEGAHLAIINSEDELKFIRGLFDKYPAAKLLGNYWKDVAFIGFHNWGESADWRTIEGQPIEEAGYAKFSPGQPDNSTAGEYCGSVLRNGLLNDLWCEMHFPFICEKKPNYPEVCDTASVRNETEHFRICDEDVEDHEKRTEDSRFVPSIDVRSAIPVF